mgnify:CR=1 FL=1
MSKQTKSNENNYNKFFPSRLRIALESEGKTQAELSRFLGISSQMIGYYKTGQSSPDWETLVKISQFFNVSVDWLLGLSDIKSCDSDIKNAAFTTGLSSESIETLHDENKDLLEQNKDEEINSFIVDCFLTKLNNFADKINIPFEINSENPKFLDLPVKREVSGEEELYKNIKTENANPKNPKKK